MTESEMTITCYKGTCTPSTRVLVKRLWFYLLSYRQNLSRNTTHDWLANVPLHNFYQSNYLCNSHNLLHFTSNTNFSNMLSKCYMEKVTIPIYILLYALTRIYIFNFLIPSVLIWSVREFSLAMNWFSELTAISVLKRTELNVKRDKLNKEYKG